MGVEQAVEKNVGLSKELLGQIVDAIVRHVNPTKIILYGSRARGDYRVTSDIDIAVDCEDGESFIRTAIDDEVRTLLKLDIVDIGRVNGNLRREIEGEGIVIYEKA
jgi:predicted nucleotidyltransferase